LKQINKGFPGVLRAFLFVALIGLFAGCGYNFRADGRPVGIEIESLAIPLVESTSSIRGFEADFTRILREEFISHGKVPLASSTQAQAVLRGKIREIREDPLSYDSQERRVHGRLTTYEVTSSRRLRVRLDIKLIDRRTGKVIWHEGKMEERAVYKIDTDPLRNRYNRKLALEKIARRLAKRIYLKTMERF